MMSVYSDDQTWMKRILTDAKNDICCPYAGLCGTRVGHTSHLRMVAVIMKLRHKYALVKDYNARETVACI